jgi:sugar/nucleoside kinase (ribokinase family)
VSAGSDAHRVVVVGDVMLDVLVTVRDARAHGSDTPSQIVTSPGGSASNQSVVLSGAGLAVSLVATVGEDPAGEAARTALSAAGVDVTWVRRASRATGTVVALVEPDGQRSMLTDRGANLELAPADVQRALEAVQPRHVHVSGYELLDDATRDVGRVAIETAALLGATRSVDASSAGPLRALGADAFLAAAAGCDWCFCNAEEAMVLTGNADPAAAAQALSSRFAEVVVTAGAAGAVVALEGQLAHAVAPRDVSVVDTVGAGDSVAGTYLARRLLGAGPHDALDDALAAAADAVARRGARGWSGSYSLE